MVRLFHFTDEESAHEILAHGFRNGETSGVWFSRYLDSWGEQSRSALIEVVIALTEEELITMEREAVADEEWDHEAGDFVQVTDSEFIERMLWFEVPAEIVNSRGSARLVSREERKGLSSGSLDFDAHAIDHET